ncbi:MAG: hypothetical protein JXC33_05310 [Deltaproteobacteria bacterium]|nr:hypothetical protein [Deltaproteobacteria bacterium]
MENYVPREINLVGVQAIYSKGELIYRDRQMIHGEIDQRQKVVSSEKK